jgi:hypothetical protein
MFGAESSQWCTDPTLGSTLSSRDREAIRLRYFEESSAEQIASGSSESVELADMVQHQVADLGIRPQTQQLSFASLLANVSNGDFQAAALGWSAAVDALLDHPRSTSDQSVRACVEGAKRVTIS